LIALYVEIDDQIEGNQRMDRPLLSDSEPVCRAVAFAYEAVQDIHRAPRP
jgi:hypothetical protein